MLALAIAASWLSSESALVTLLDYAVARSGGKLAIDKPRGTLLGRIEIRSDRLSRRRHDGDGRGRRRSITRRGRCSTEDSRSASWRPSGVRIDVEAQGRRAGLDAGFARDPDRRDDRARDRRTSRMAIRQRRGCARPASDSPMRAIGARIDVQDLDIRGAGGRLAGSASVGTDQAVSDARIADARPGEAASRGTCAGAARRQFRRACRWSRSPRSPAWRPTCRRSSRRSRASRSSRASSTRRTSILRASTRMAHDATCGRRRRKAIAWRIHRARAHRERNARTDRCESHSDRAVERRIHAVRRDARVARADSAGRRRNAWPAAAR